MALLLVNKKDLYHFQNIDDMQLWYDDNCENQEVIVIADDYYDEDFQDFLDENAPVIIEDK